MIECAIGRLKRRFAILHQEIRTDIESVPAIITTCCILHNIILQQKIKERVMAKFNLETIIGDSDDDLFDPDQPETTVYNGPDHNGKAYRLHIARQI